MASEKGKGWKPHSGHGRGSPRLLMPTWVALLAIAIALAAALYWFVVRPAVETPAAAGKLPAVADPGDATLVALGQKVYAGQCASCHGAELEGEKDWQQRRADGGLRAPPHDETGHTWHHPDRLLFQITKFGGQSIAPQGFKSNMPKFGDKLTDKEIIAALAFIKSTWPARVREIHGKINQRNR